ncbi:energy transducer TonB [uncultured Muribaculum sp.]|uniref:energy transducer TonB family protein n=1 Tax=uncultured Muribaculum sp. TaxID=1918613 RepID=UPI00272DBF0F|nr:energy transducer TonB [uncultured Muribaculum sp.]
MKNLLLAVLLLFQVGVLSAQHCCVNDSVIREIQFPLTERDTETVFYYFNEEWICGAVPDMIEPDSILKIEIKNDEYDNRAVFITVSLETLSQLKSKVDETYRNLFVNYDPQCEFPGGNGKLKEWIEANIRVPEGYKGTERVVAQFKVQPDGSVTDAKILRPSKNEAANAEALRLVNALPKFRVKYFTPKKAPLCYAMPIVFKEPGLIYIR